MKKLTFILVLLSSGLYAQSDLHALLATTQESFTNATPEMRIENFIASIHPSQHQNKQLRTIFKKVHATFLKEYEAYSEFDKIFSTGHYDCLTATALFSNILDRFGYSYNIIETNYHIFVMVQTSDGEVMIETTDRVGGFITRKEAIANRICQYKKNIPIVANSNGYVHTYSFSLFQEISDKKLIGLLYFNQAVKFYNHQNFSDASIFLEKANALYASPRCESMGTLLVQTIRESRLDEKTKADCMARLKVILLKKSDLIASN